MNGDASSLDPPPTVGDGLADAWRVGLTGANAWLVALLVPTLGGGWPTGGALAVVLVAALTLMLAVALTLRGPTADALATVARWVLLALAPATLGAMVAIRTDVGARAALSAPTLILLTLSVLAYVAAAARASTRPPQRLGVTVHALRSKQPVSEPRARRWMRRLLLAASTAGAAAIALIAPTLTDGRGYATHWGESADAAAVLTTVVACLVAGLAIGAIVGPGLRARRARSGDERRRKRRLALSAAVALLAVAAYVALRFFDASA